MLPMFKRRRDPMNVEKERGVPVDTASGPRPTTHEQEGQGTAPIGASGIWSEGIEDESQGSEYLDAGASGSAGDRDQTGGLDQEPGASADRRRPLSGDGDDDEL